MLATTEAGFIGQEYMLVSRGVGVQRQITTGIAVVRSSGRYLIGVRPEGTDLAGCHEFPGGKCLPGESPADCAIRECLEETGVEVRKTRDLLETRHVYEHATVLLNFVLCDTVPIEQGELATPNEPFRWVPSSEMSDLNFPDGNAEVLALLEELDALDETVEL